MSQDGSKKQEPAADLAHRVPEALLHLEAAMQAGAPWHRSLLEAVGLWTLPQEVFQDRNYRYLIHGEAFDWLLLAERLCAELDGAIPLEDKELLLFSGKLPEAVEADEFKDLLGTSKYRGYLNYWYGVVVEEALQLAVEEGSPQEAPGTLLPGQRRPGGGSLQPAIRQNSRHTAGRVPKKCPHARRRRALSLSDLKEFTYWLHKRRLNMWDPARVASDTRKGTRRLRQLEGIRAPAPRPDPQ